MRTHTSNINILDNSYVFTKEIVHVGVDIYVYCIFKYYLYDSYVMNYDSYITFAFI